MPKRCVSKCQNIPERECITKERCFYTKEKLVNSAVLNLYIKWILKKTVLRY